jgi:hypothetical protein
VGAAEAVLDPDAVLFLAPAAVPVPPSALTKAESGSRVPQAAVATSATANKMA